MLRNQQNLGQRLQQGMQQKLSPQQLQYIKLLQLTTQGLEQRIKEELETNPILEQLQSEEDWDRSDQEPLDSPEIDYSDGMTQSSEKGLESLEEQKVDWDTYKDNTEYDGDIVFAELPEKGSNVEKDGTAGVVESTKAASDVYTPVSGEVVDTNQAIVDDPSKINEDPEGSAWFFKLKMKDQSEMDSLMNKEEYDKFAKESAS